MKVTTASLHSVASVADLLLALMVSAEAKSKQPVTDKPQWFHLFPGMQYRNSRYDLSGIGTLEWEDGNGLPSIHDTLDYLVRQGLVREQPQVIITPGGAMQTSQYVPTEAGRNSVYVRR